ncbi:MAG: glucose-6-phosphate isomerase, partial [Fusobacteriota bacterium]
MSKITLDYSKAVDFFNEKEINNMEGQVNNAAKLLEEKSGPGNEFLGWLDLPENYDKEEFARIKESAQEVKANSDVLLVIGIGGSYLGARAAIEALTHSFHNNLSKKDRDYPEIYYVGNNMSSTYIKDLLELIQDKDVSINVISKSGTTTETAISFRIFREFLEEKYGEEEANRRIFATTDKSKGALKELSEKKGYETFVVPDNVGGRFSILTAVGLFPIAVAGVDIDKLMAGAKKAMDDLKAPFKDNSCYKYAAIRNILNRKGKNIEIMVNYEPSLHYVSEWWKQ